MGKRGRGGGGGGGGGGFSGRKKKDQMKAKKERKRVAEEERERALRHNRDLAIFSLSSPQEPTDGEGAASSVASTSSSVPSSAPIHSSDQQDRRRLTTVFEKEDKNAVKARVQLGMEPVDRKDWKMYAGDVVMDDFVDMPKRPPCDATTEEELTAAEEKYFLHYLEHVYSSYDRKRLNFFEHNLEVWRQLWRVLERSDVVCLIVDIRHPVFHFPAALYHHVTRDLRKPVVIVLTKVDVVPEPVRHAWVRYFLDLIPDLAGICLFSCRWNEIPPVGQDMSELSVENLLECVRRASGAAIESDVMVGMVGHPNVGKSSVINCLMGEKRVSVSHTPGHTKHFQTLFLTEHMQLCDCPGLVFPALDKPKELQILLGVFPIAQVREPYSAIRLLAERSPLEEIYRLTMIDDYPPDTPWSPFNLCEAFARKKRYFISRSGREDTHRAGNQILRDCVDGFLQLYFLPSNMGPEEAADLPPLGCIRAYKTKRWKDNLRRERDAVLEEGEDSDELLDEEELQSMGRRKRGGRRKGGSRGR